jgi:hypothetical protein
MLLRTMILAAWCVLATGCVAVADRERVAAAEPSEASAELECMSDCLGESDVSCEDCATRCFSAPTGVVLSFSH